jgi:hypothetical protein
MKKIVDKPFVVSLLILTVLGCATAEKQESMTSPQGKKSIASFESSTESLKKGENDVNRTPEKNVTSKKTLIFNVSSCSWSYMDENGILEAVSIIDGKPQYVRSGSVHYIDLDKSKIVFK